jgi:hypothetical protein
MAREIRPSKLQIHATNMQIGYGHRLAQHTLFQRSLSRMCFG